MIVYGRNPVRELLRGMRSHAVGRVWATASVAREPWLAARRPEVVDAGQVLTLCGSESHQGVCAEAGPYPYRGAGEVLGRARPVVVALDEVQDPQNLGAICRSAECAGASAVVITERRAAHVTPAVCKASAGAVEHLPVVRVGNMARFLGEAKQAGCWCYGASAGDGADYTGVDLSGGVVLVLGAEGRGLRPRVRGCCDALVSVPVRGRIESLNVAAAATVLLYAALQGENGLDKTP